MRVKADHVRDIGPRAKRKTFTRLMIRVLPNKLNNTSRAMQYGQPRRADRRFSGNPAWVHQKLCSFDIASRWKRPNSPPISSRGFELWTLRREFEWTRLCRGLLNTVSKHNNASRSP